MASAKWCVRRTARWLAPALVFAACASATAPAANTAPSSAVILDNQGGTLEGHTPRGFAGMGTGLFAGDNLNPGFPDGDGVQIYLTFEATGPVSGVSSAVLSSHVLTVQGTPFEDLGAFSAEAVVYDAFAAALFDLRSTGPAAACERVGSSRITCDVTDAVRQTIDAGEERFQFRLRFDRAGDGDGRPDLAMFFVTDSNTNEAGIFTLSIEN